MAGMLSQAGGPFEPGRATEPLARRRVRGLALASSLALGFSNLVSDNNDSEMP
jgi:hypothetical protein